jgi:hypothetical protein
LEGTFVALIPQNKAIWASCWTVQKNYLLTPWSRVLLEKLTGFAASQEIPRIYGTRKLIWKIMNSKVRDVFGY